MSHQPEYNPDLIKRHAIRAILLTPELQTLLIKVQEPVSGRQLWIAPGGGTQDGETPEACLRRELYEETGLNGFCLGPRIWTRRHTFTWANRQIEQHEEYYLIETELFEPSLAENPDVYEKNDFRGFRWWTLKAINTSGDLFVPRRLGKYLKQLIHHGPPEQPFDAGI